jgi:hypothetical protein
MIRAANGDVVVATPNAAARLCSRSPETFLTPIRNMSGLTLARCATSHMRPAVGSASILLPLES